MNFDCVEVVIKLGFPGGTVVKNLSIDAEDARDLGLIQSWSLE